MIAAVLGAVFGLFLAFAGSTPVLAAAPDEPPFLAAKVEAGTLPPVAERLPQVPGIAARTAGRAEEAKQGGRLYTLMASAKDVRMMVVYGYSRLVGYNEKLELEPDIAERVDVEGGRIFTFHLRPGHRWSDGYPFTAEDFRYWWEDVANRKELSPSGPPVEMIVDGEKPSFEVLGPTVVRYAWSKPNPAFLPALAGASPLFIYRPAHYLKQFHAAYVDPKLLEARVRAERQRNWQSLHNKLDNQYRNDNPDLPTLDPWINTTAAPAQRFVFVRNPYYHRVDTLGRQLPYIDEVILNLAGGDLIPAKVASGDSDLQARYLRFDNLPFLKQAEEREDYTVRLWKTGKGAHLALYPNLNVDDPVWRELFRDVRFRRALSLATNRHEINKVIFYGLAVEGNNSMLPESPLYEREFRFKWAAYEPKRAAALLDEIGLRRGPEGVRLLPDGRPAVIVVESAGESTEESDVLQLVHDSWLKVGIKIYTKPLQREVFRNRIFAGQTQMSIWSGLENGLATAAMSPAELAPTSQQQLQWPKWGQHYESRGRSGTEIDLAPARKLMDLYRQWRAAADDAEKERVWKAMLAVNADQVFSIGLIGGVLQPVVVANRLRNVPEKGFYNWDPGAHFGIYRPDTFWLTGPRQN